MSDGIHLTAYHDAVKEQLKSALPWLNSISAYPDVETTLTTPCAFFGVTDFDKSDEQPMNGQMAVTLNCEVLAVLAMDLPQFQLEARNAAMAIGLAIEGNRFGMPIEPAVFVSAEPDAFSPELDDYAVWSIRFNQTVNVGDDVYKPTGLRPTQVNVGYRPDTGPNNQSSYEAVVDE